MKNDEQIENDESEKVIILTASGKGGAGKSTFTFIAAEKNPEAIILDSDDASKSSLQHLAYRSPIPVSFLDNSGRIDRNAFNNMFESIASVNRRLFISDTGASVSEQLPMYLESLGADVISELLLSFNIKLKIICVVCGKNDFRTTMEYLGKLIESSRGFIEIIAAHNRHFEMSSDQQEKFELFCNENKIQYLSYDLLADKSEMSLRIAADVLKAGKGLTGLSPFKAIYFRKAIQDLAL